MTQTDWPTTREPELEDYTRGDCVGSGGQAAVYKYLPPQSNIVVAVKVLRLCGTTEKQRAWFNREILQGIENAHPRLLRLLTYFPYEEGFALVMPYYPLGSLATVQANIRFDMGQRKDAIRQLLHGLRWLHVQNRIHRDVKPWNVLVQELNPLSLVLTDFGQVSMSHAVSFTGTAGYRAPEVFLIRDESSEMLQKTAVDIYSLGMTLIWLLTPQVYAHGLPRTQPWTEGQHDQLVGSLLEDAIDRNPNADERDALAAARIMTHWDPDSRGSADDCLQLPWLLTTTTRKSPRQNGKAKNYRPFSSRGGVQKSRMQKGKAKHVPVVAGQQDPFAPARAAEAPLGGTVAANANANDPFKEEEDVKEAKRYSRAMELCT